MDDTLRNAKLAKLIEIEGYDSVEDLAEAVLSEAVSPAICINEGCDFTCEMEPDQDAGYCEECRANRREMHALVYRVSGKGAAQQLEIAACRYHY